MPWRELHVLRDASSRLAGGSRRGTYWQRGCRRGAASAAARCEEVRPICLLRSAARRTTYLYLYLSCLYITAWGCNQLSLRLRPTLTDPTYPELALDYLCTKSTKHLNILEIRNLAPVFFAGYPLICVRVDCTLAPWAGSGEACIHASLMSLKVTYWRVWGS